MKVWKKLKLHTNGSSARRKIQRYYDTRWCGHGMTASFPARHTHNMCMTRRKRSFPCVVHTICVWSAENEVILWDKRHFAFNIARILITKHFELKLPKMRRTVGSSFRSPMVIPLQEPSFQIPINQKKTSYFLHPLVRFRTIALRRGPRSDRSPLVPSMSVILVCHKCLKKTG